MDSAQSYQLCAWLLFRRARAGPLTGGDHGGTQTARSVEKPAEARRHPPSRRAVYTAIFGQYDRLHELPDGIGADADFICFTDDETLACPGWEVRAERPRYPHPRMAAKEYKTLPHVVLPEYEETAWIDGSFRIGHAAFAREIFSYLQPAGMALFLHPDRGCIYDEAEVSRGMPKYAGQNLQGQVSHYRAQGYPEKNGLFACGVIARRRDDPAIRHLSELWMLENLRFIYHDQLSLPFLVWKLGLSPAVFRMHLWQSRWGSWEIHAHAR